MKRGTEDLDFFIGDEAIAATAGPGGLYRSLPATSSADRARLWIALSDQARPDRELGMLGCSL